MTLYAFVMWVWVCTAAWVCEAYLEAMTRVGRELHTIQVIHGSCCSISMRVIYIAEPLQHTAHMCSGYEMLVSACKSDMTPPSPQHHRLCR